MGEIVSIAAERPFARTLAFGLLERFGPVDLARVRLLLPSRRAALVLQDAFLDVTGGAPLLLPRLAAVGDVAFELDVLDGAVDLAVAPPLDDLRRRFVLFTLVRAVDASLPHEHGFRLADSLASLLDELADEDVAPALLADLDLDAAAEHWQRIARFLAIVATTWSTIEAEEGGLGRSERRRRLLRAVADHWRAQPPGPVVLAGVTGSVPAVADLAAAVAALPEGLVVLPGVDPDVDGAERETMGPTHPQWGLVRLLARLGHDAQTVGAWPEGASPTAARRRLLGAMARPSALPPMALDAAAALDGVERLEAPDVATEALAIALAVRDLLQGDGRALIVAPDRQLARRVSADLARFELQVEDSGGRPLDQTAPGVFVLLAVHACLDDAPIVSWLALLKHPLARGGTDAATCRRLARRLDLALRLAPRRGLGAAPGWASIEAAVGADTDLATWFAPIAEATAALRQWSDAERVPFTGLLDGLERALGALAADADGDQSELWAGAAGASLATFLADLRAAARDVEPIAPAAFAPMLASAMATRPVRRVEAGHPRIEILGRFEARLMAADLVVLAGLNEGAWPEAPEPGPWLGRAQRQQLGLPAPEQHIGFAAHDFVQLAAGTPRLLLTRSRRDAAGTPTQRSRFLEQLDRALARLGADATIAPSPALGWASGFDRSPGAARPRPRPEPRPPTRARPTLLSVSDIERLLHNPYAVYAERVLGLSPLDPPDRAVDARDRGTLVHAALERFERAHGTVWPTDALERLLAAGREVFAVERLGAAVVALWGPRYVRVANWLATTEATRRRGVAAIEIERPVAAEVAAGGLTLTLRGRIDRLDRLADGRVVLYDYKTGTTPTKADVIRGERPQLPLLGWLLATADGVAVDGLAYLELKGGEPAGRLTLVADGSSAVMAEVEAGVRRLLAAYGDPRVPYLPVPRPEAAPRLDAYAPLSRDLEWLDAEDAPS